MISECAHQTFTFDGRCYNVCPERTFIVPEKVSAQSKGLSLKRRALHTDEFDSLADILGKTESLAKNNRAISLGSAEKLCGSCNPVCSSCKGPDDSDCVICDSEYNQIIIGSSIICRLKSDNTTATLNSITNQLKGYSLERLVLVSSLIGVALLISSISMYSLCIKCNCDVLPSITSRFKQLCGKEAPSQSGTSTSTAKYTYNPIRDELDEKPQQRMLLSSNNKFGIITTSDDDSDDDDDDVGGLEL